MSAPQTGQLQIPLDAVAGAHGRAECGKRVFGNGEILLVQAAVRVVEAQELVKIPARARRRYAEQPRGRKKHDQREQYRQNDPQNIHIQLPFSLYAQPLRYFEGVMPKLSRNTSMK